MKRFFLLVVGVALIPLCPLVAGAQEALNVGPWSAILGEAGPVMVSYQGQPLFHLGQVIGYQPAWQGRRFDLSGAEVTRTENAAKWHKAEPGNQEALLELELTPPSCRLTLETTITAAGPTEFSIQIAPEAVRADENRGWMWLDGDVQILSLREGWEKVSGFQELRFEREDRTVTVRCEGFELQDRRARGDGLFLVRVIGSDGARPRRVESEVELTVAEADPAARAGRRALLSQEPVEYKPCPVENAGFEADRPLAGWSPNPHAGADTETKHRGKRAARLTIWGEVAERGHVYLVQQVPVRERRLYQAEAWIKAQEVKSASVGGLSSTGATLIIEFADKQGRWLAPGSYVPGLYGTTDWRRVRTDAARAPAGAGYAILFLALRAHGTAWFDDVALREVQENVLLLNPLPGQEVADNTPAFNWFYGRETESTLELCRDPHFPDGQVITLPDLQTTLTSPHEPLAPGKWFWRVRVPAHDATSPVWDFLQTAPRDQDTTEPQIDVVHGWLPAEDTPVRITYTDNVGVTQVTLSVDGQDVPGSVQVGPQEAIYVPEGGWTEGLHKVLVRAADAAGNRAEQVLFFTHSKVLPRTTWRPVGGVDTDGEKRFLFGMYGVRIEDMPEIAAGGFDFVHSYQWDGAGTNEEALEYLDEAHRHGLQAFIGFSRRRLMKGDEPFVAERVGALMRHPGLFAWYLYDEPDLSFQYVSPRWLTRYYQLIKALDPFHPVVVTCAQDDPVAEYRTALDVHWTQVYGPTDFVAGRLEKHRRLLKPDTPLAAILHCFDGAQTEASQRGEPTDPDRFQPDGRLMRANAFMALAHNSSGLIWWWWGEGSDQYYTVRHAPAAWAALRQTVADLKALRPVLTAEGDIHTWIERPQEGVEVHLWAKKLPGRTVLMAVNRDESPCDLCFQSEILPPRGSGQVLFEGRRVEVTEGQLRDHFEPLEVHVYEFN